MSDDKESEIFKKGQQGAFCVHEVFTKRGWSTPGNVMADLAVGRHQCFAVENVMLVSQWCCVKWSLEEGRVALPSSWLSEGHDFPQSSAKEQPFFSSAGNCVSRANAASSSSRGFCNPVRELKGWCSWIRFLLWQSNSMQAEGCFICLVADPRVCSLKEATSKAALLGPRETSSRRWSLSSADEQVSGRSGKGTY